MKEMEVVILIICGGLVSIANFIYHRFLIRSILGNEAKIGYYDINIWEKELIERLKKHSIGNTR